MKRTLSVLINRIKDLKIFKRNKVDILTKIVSALMTNAGLSLRKTANIASIVLTKVSHVSVRKYHRALRKVIDVVKPKHREIIAVDETKLKVNGRLVIIYGAVDVETEEILAIRVTPDRSELQTYLFMREVKKKCIGRTKVLTDKGPWYTKWSLRGFEHEHMTFGLRNSIERCFGIIKDRTKRFYNNINCKNFKSGIENLQAFLEVFVGLYNLEKGF